MNAISWSDYEGVDGFGSGTQAEVDELNKALHVGNDINPPGSVTAGDGFSLRVESLDSTLRSVSYKMKHLVLWSDIIKGRARNTVEEYNVLHSFGNNPDGGWMAEGGLPAETDASLERKHATVKFLGTHRKVSHVATLVDSAHGNVIAQETVNGTMDLLQKIERGLFKGDSSLSDLQWDGIEKQMVDNMVANNIIDLRGAPLSEDILTDASLTASDAPSYGFPDKLYLNPKTSADLAKQFFPKERINTLDAKTGKVGLNVNGWVSPAGEVDFRPSVFIDDGGAPNAAIVGKVADIPGIPVISVVLASPVDATAQFTAADAGTYSYSLSAVNDKGRSAAIALGTIAVAAGDAVTVSITPAAGNAPKFYQLYRTKVGGAVGTERSIMRIPNTAGAGLIVLTDKNAFLPGCTSGYLLQMDAENLDVKMLTPMMKMNLALVSTEMQWLQLIYMTVRLMTPNKNILFRNIGRASGYVGAP
jgi:hypothetical protein